MKWKITVQPTSDALDSWRWQAEGEDGESVLFDEAEYALSETALGVARDRVAEVELRRSVIAEATIVEEYIPSEAEILAAR
jgi:hypothetical protein